ncbi:hypothetical protein CI109_104939 [Kwoniella shandongensis]|uniref:D-isomer specific 2-hydroxyacid dehydrogenase NAD-binding domain-containing protein n=1 Tax=Kwoniella shandongensis TaxID=1734106 RepID=A0A5M6BWI6_9TREE|nr:uncharacterized protein CI109_006268 [Kwoniella shandongensis]KAA5525369.1 hypothetical protein CI109_006268 [Kwoniella shandongensis]
MSSLPLTLGCTVALSPESQEKLKSTFSSVIYKPASSKEEFTSDELSKIEIFFTRNTGPPAEVKSLDQVPKLKHVQLASAGADKAIQHPIMQEHAKLQKDQGKDQTGQLTLSTASGTHVLSIPNYAVGMVICLLHQLPRQIIAARNEKRWLSETEADADGEVYYARSTFNRTAGFLGYGALGRETARLLKAHGMRIVAANTSGKASPQDGYIIPGTGDKEGSLPDEYYSTKDPKSVEKFLNQCDVLVASLPNTPATKGFLNKDRLALLPPQAVIVNVGRGNAIPSDDLIAALDKPNGLFGAALDVTDPEPLPDNHPLFSHPKVIITPHVSGNTEGEMDIAADIVVENGKRLSEGKDVLNRVEFERGY